MASGRRRFYLDPDGALETAIQPSTSISVLYPRDSPEFVTSRLDSKEE